MINSAPMNNSTPNGYRDAQGRRLTLSLFVETNTSGQPAKWTLGDDDILNNDGEVLYPSAKRMYLESMDVTEYEAALAICENWDHWEKLLDSPPIRREIDKWRRELEVRVRSVAIRTIRQSPSAADHKWLAERKWLQKGAGRPTKQAKAESSSADQALRDDLARMRGESRAH